MSSLFNTFRTSARPVATGAFGLFFSTPAWTRGASSGSPAARCTKFLVRNPSEVAPRECPTPLILLRAKGIAGDETTDSSSWAKDWAAMFAERGYTAVEVDIESGSSSGTAAERMNGMVSELAHQVRLLAIPFPPVIISHSSSTLLSQAYISDNPASGIVLVSPPVDNASIASSTEPENLLPEFNFEPHFPVLVVASSDLAERLRTSNRLVRDYAPRGIGRGGKGVSFEEVQDPTSERTRMTIERWMDRCGY
ncbi:hypothetical protein NliqN6_0624 [Naganishia liquefaciens]|uniref:Alpha/beta hydrolase n=1 Tax=Naganishia liquefaciens TaxID=104408 RepID=A0A8H3YDE7_9TREE|nr:hypothetical protein NliqN6_0624 [Naganishia liquefaciens]